MPYKDPERRREAARLWRKANPDKIKTCRERWAAKNPDKMKTYKERWKAKNPTKVKEYTRLSNQRCAERIREYQIGWIARNPDKYQQSLKRRRDRWRAKNPTYLKQYNRERRARDAQFAIVNRLRSRLGHAIRLHGSRKTDSTFNLIGCSIEELIVKIEEQFLPDMSWENRHLWHIDHKVPCSSFELNDPAQQRQCFHWSNLQPLWKVDNLRKGTKLFDGEH